MGKENAPAKCVNMPNFGNLRDVDVQRNRRATDDRAHRTLFKPPYPMTQICHLPLPAALLAAARPEIRVSVPSSPWHLTMQKKGFFFFGFLPLVPPAGSTGGLSSAGTALEPPPPKPNQPRV